MTGEGTRGHLGESGQCGSSLTFEGEQAPAMLRLNKAAIKAAVQALQKAWTFSLTLAHLARQGCSLTSDLVSALPCATFPEI